MSNNFIFNFFMLFIFVNYMNAELLMGGKQIQDVKSCSEPHKFLKRMESFLKELDPVKCEIQIVNGVNYFITYYLSHLNKTVEYLVYEPAVTSNNDSRFKIINKTEQSQILDN